jgi:two-component system, sensor histidine kinase
MRKSPFRILSQSHRAFWRFGLCVTKVAKTGELIWILGFGLFSLFLIWLGALYFSRADFSQTENAAYQNATNLARAFEEHIIRVLQAYDQTLLFVRSSYANDPDRFNLANWAHQQHFVSDLAVQVAIVDKNGLLRDSNLSGASRYLDLSDRDHFRVHMNTSRDELYISTPVIGRVSNRWSLQLSRRISAANGSFLGVVVVSIDPYNLSNFYESIDTKEHGAVFLVGLDGVVRARASGTDLTVGQSLAMSTLFDRLAQADSGSFLSKGQLDGTPF